MQFTTGEILTWLGHFLWPWIRVGALMLSAPVFSAIYIPTRIRVLLGVALTVAVMPAVQTVPAVDPLSLAGVLLAFQQVLIGVAMGMLLSMAFAAVTIAGETVSMTMGLGFATMADPQSGVAVPVLSQFLLILITLLFLAVGGHLMLIELLAESFIILPLDAVGLTRDDFFRLVSFASQMFAGGVLIALPAIILLLLVNLALGVMTRAAPQMNIFSVGFPVTMTMGFLAVLFLVMPSLPARMSALWSAAFDVIRAVLTVS